ncbi:hypothetical protein AB8880_02045 [Alphaproteobacteria bacterium LSUCC0684]
MTNTLDSIAPKILARGMISFREKAFMPRLMNMTYSAEAAQKGDVVDIMLPGTITVEDVTPGTIPAAAPDKEVQTWSLKLDRWKKVAFSLTDKELMQIDADQHFIPHCMQEAISALAEEVNKSFFEDTYLCHQIVGSPNRNLFSEENTDRLTDSYKSAPVIKGRQILNRNKAPKSGRYVVLSYEDEARALRLSEIADAQRTSDAGVPMEGEIGRKYGMHWYSTDQVITHEPVHKTYCKLTKDATKGATELNFTKLKGGGLKSGDIIVDGNNFILCSIEEILETPDDNTAKVKLAMPLDKDISKDDHLFAGGTHNNGVLFHRDAFAFANRPLAAASQDYSLGNRIISVTDPESGLSLRLEISRQYKQTVWEFDILWGIAMVQRDLVVRLASKE